MDERLLGDPENPYPEGMDGPTVDIPSVSAGEIRHSKLLRLFVLQVFIWNAVLLTVSVGLLLLYFETDWRTGSQLIGIGVVLAIYGAYRWPNRDSAGQAPR